MASRASGDLQECGVVVAARRSGVKRPLDKPPAIWEASRCKASPTEGDTMSLNEQAAGAVDALVADVATEELDEYAVALARLAWLDGFEAGAKATKQKADEAFAAWQAAQS